MSKLERIVHDDSNGLDYILVGEIYLPSLQVGSLCGWKQLKSD